MAFEAFLIALDATLAEEFSAALAPLHGPVHRLAAAAQLRGRIAPRSMPRLVVVVDDAAKLDPAWWRALRAADAPQARLLIACRICSDETWRRWITLGAVAVLRAPFATIDLEAEFADEPAVSHLFRRQAELATHGKAMFRYVFPSDPQFIPGVVHMVSLLTMEFGFDAADYTTNVPLAVDEAVSNAIIHGNQRSARKRVEVEGQIDSELLRLKVRDEGDGFVRDSSHDPVQPENLLAASGRGLFLIESVMDEVRFSQQGRCIEMLKRRVSAAPKRV